MEQAVSERDSTTDWASAGRARVEVRARLAALGLEDLSGDAELVVTELVTNAMLHGGGYRGVHVVPLTAGVRVEVADVSAVPPLLGRASEDAMTGRGLRLVNSLAARWGASAAGSGKVVWAELTGDGPGDHELTEQDLLAMWDDE